MTAMCTVELDFACDICGLLVEDGEGSLYVRHADIQAHHRAQEGWQQVNGQALLIIPDYAPWLIHHYACESRESDGYHIGVEQVRTWRLLVAWTAQLMGKPWLPSTDWGHVIGAAATGRDQRIAAHAKDDAA